MKSEKIVSPEDKFSKLEQFFSSDERKEAFLNQALSRDEINDPDFVFHVTSALSVKARETGSADDKWFSFSKDAFLSLMMLDHRFLNKLSNSGLAVTDEDSYKPVFIIGDYHQIQETAGYEEKEGLEKGHEIEIKMPYSDLIADSLVIGNAQNLADLIEYFTQSTPETEQKKLAIRGLSGSLKKWQDIETLVGNKLKKGE